MSFFYFSFSLCRGKDLLYALRANLKTIIKNFNKSNFLNIRNTRWIQVPFLAPSHPYNMLDLKEVPENQDVKKKKKKNKKKKNKNKENVQVITHCTFLLAP